MVIMTIILVIFIPRHSKVGRVFDNARNMLLCVTVLTIIHFVLQYYFHFNEVPNLADKRSVVNLLFGIPTSFFMNMAVLYILRSGRVGTREWLVAPITLCIALALFLFSEFTHNQIISLHSSSLIISVLYAITLISYHVMQIKQYLILRNTYDKKNSIEVKWLNWHKWTIILLCMVDTAMPFMIFNLNETQRYFYGIFTLFVAFFVIMRFIIFGYTTFAGILKTEDISDLEKEKVQKEKEEKTAAEDSEMARLKESLSPMKLKMISDAAEKMVNSGYYLTIGITMKDVAEQMGVSRNLLTAWLQTTEHKQFNKWLMNLRIQEAKRLLIEHPDWTNEAVARTCGYSDRSYFQKQFRMIEGMTPAKWYEENKPKTEDEQ